MGGNVMRAFDKVQSGSLERRELRVILLACLAIIVLAAGLALFMYPVVFSEPASPPAQPPPRALSIAFFGFCVLSILLAVYLVDRQVTIRRLRQQIGEERRRPPKAPKQPTAHLLRHPPHSRSFTA